MPVYDRAFVEFSLPVNTIKSHLLQLHVYIFLFYSDETRKKKKKTLKTAPNNPSVGSTGQFLLLHTCIPTCTRDPPSAHTRTRTAKELWATACAGARGDQTQPPRSCDARF